MKLLLSSLPSFAFFCRNKLGYLKDSNAAAHFVDSDIFYAVIRQPVRSKTYIKLYFLKRGIGARFYQRRGMTRDRDLKVPTDLNYVLTKQYISLNLPSRMKML